MLIAVNRDFMLESRCKSKKINIVLYQIWLPFQKEFTVSITLFSYTTYTYSNRVNYIEIANGIRSTFYSNIEHETWNRYRVYPWLNPFFPLFFLRYDEWIELQGGWPFSNGLVSYQGNTVSVEHRGLTLNN